MPAWLIAVSQSLELYLGNKHSYMNEGLIEGEAERSVEWGLLLVVVVGGLHCL